MTAAGRYAGTSSASELPHPPVDLVADGADRLDVLPGRVVELPVEVALAREDGHASPQPMVMTTSAARTTSSVSGFGNSWAMSMPSSAMAATTAGLISSPGSDPADRTSHPSFGVAVQQRRGHLRSPGVVHADEENLGDVGHGGSSVGFVWAHDSSATSAMSG